ncbi:hypothetical protein D3C86_2054220 [compost metagenome]
MFQGKAMHLGLVVVEVLRGAGCLAVKAALRQGQATGIAQLVVDALIFVKCPA